MSMEGGDQASLQETINAKLQQSGERDRLKQLLRERYGVYDGVLPNAFFPEQSSGGT